MIHPTAVIDPGAKIAEDVRIGPYSIIGADVEIGPGCEIGPHVVMSGPTRIGRDNRVFQFASLGEVPQDKKYAGEPTLLEIGDRNVIREYCTIHRGTVQGGGVTRVGNDNWIMAYVHIAHDCIVGDHTTFSNAASLAGHVEVGDWAILGGFTLVHQFCAIGAHAFCGMGTAVGKDLPPYVMANGNPAHTHGLNTEGLKRRGFDADTLTLLRRAYKVIYRSSLGRSEAVRELERLNEDGNAELQLLIDFLKREGRGIVR